MKLNKQLIERLANGEIAVDNSNHNLELLKAVLKEAFLRDNSIPQGKSTYYQKHSKDYWVALEFTILPTILLSDFLEEECVLPEKWCIKLKDNYDIINKWGKDYWENITSWGSLNASSEYMICSFKDKICTSANSTNGYIEITFEQFKKSILKQETMKKEIIGYKLVKSEYKGAYEEITGTSNLDRIEDALGKLNWVDKAIKDLKEAGVLELWFKPNYKEEKTIVKMYSSNKGEFEIEVVGKKAYYRPEHKELSLQFIKNILNLFENKTIGLEYSIEVDSLKVGCMEGTRKSDWQKVYDLIK